MAAWEQLYKIYFGLSNPSMPSPLPMTTVFLNLGIVESCLDCHRFWKDRSYWHTRRRDDIVINVAVMISSSLREEERRRHSTKAWTEILTIKCWDVKEEEAEAAVDRMDSIHDFTPFLTVSWLHSTLLVVISVVVLLLLVLVPGKHRSRV